MWIPVVPLILCLHCTRAAMCTRKSRAEPILATSAAALSSVGKIVTLHRLVVLSSHNCSSHNSSTVQSQDFHQDKAYEEHVCTSLFLKSWSFSIIWLAGEKGSRERRYKMQRELISCVTDGALCLCGNSSSLLCYSYISGKKEGLLLHMSVWGSFFGGFLSTKLKVFARHLCSRGQPRVSAQYYSFNSTFQLSVASVKIVVFKRYPCDCLDTVICDPCFCLPFQKKQF